MTSTSTAPKSKAKPGKPGARQSMTFAGHKVVGVTRDGVRILDSGIKATHFTTEEIREAIATVRAARTAKSS